MKKWNGNLKKLTASILACALFLSLTACISNVNSEAKTKNGVYIQKKLTTYVGMTNEVGWNLKKAKLISQTGKGKVKCKCGMERTSDGGEEWYAVKIKGVKAGKVTLKLKCTPSDKKLKPVMQTIKITVKAIDAPYVTPKEVTLKYNPNAYADKVKSDYGDWYYDAIYRDSNGNIIWGKDVFVGSEEGYTDFIARAKDYTPPISGYYSFKVRDKGIVNLTTESGHQKDIHGIFFNSIGVGKTTIDVVFKPDNPNLFNGKKSFKMNFTVNVVQDDSYHDFVDIIDI